MKEDDPANPLTTYGRSKLKAEGYCCSFASHLPVTILRPSAVYGPRDKEMLFFFKAVACGLKPTFGFGERYINLTYVKDLARAVIASIEKESNGIYFVAERRAYSYSQAGDIMAQIMKRRALDIHIPEGILRLVAAISEKVAQIRKRPAMFTSDKAVEISQKFWLVDPSKAERELGIKAWTDFKAAAVQTIEWYKGCGWL